MINSLFVDHPVIKDQLETFVVHVRRVDDFSARNNLRSWKFGCRSFSPTEVKTRIPLQKDPEGVSFCKYKWWVCFFLSHSVYTWDVNSNNTRSSLSYCAVGRLMRAWRFRGWWRSSNLKWIDTSIVYIGSTYTFKFYIKIISHGEFISFDVLY
jgi:hypothetical protein